MPVQTRSIALVAGTAGLVLVALAAVGFAAYEQAAGQLLESARDKYLALVEVRRDELEQHLERVAGEVRFWSDDRAMREVLGDLSAAWARQGPRASQRLRSAYVLNNPYPVGQRHQLDVARDGSDYSTLHGAHHPWMRRFLDQHGYTDVYLFDAEGNLVYTAEKEDDFGTSFLGGPYRESGLGEVFRAARSADRPDAVAFSDFAPYAPSHGRPAAFVGSPVTGEGGRVRGVLAFQLGLGPINEIMQKQAGLAGGGETYLVGTDKRMRSDSRLVPGSTAFSTRVDTPAVERALAGDTGTLLGTGFRGEPVFAAYTPLAFRGLTWVVVAEVPEEAVLGPIHRLRNFLVVSTVVAMLVLSAILGIALSLLLNRPAPEPTPTAHTSYG